MRKYWNILKYVSFLRSAFFRQKLSRISRTIVFSNVLFFSPNLVTKKFNHQLRIWILKTEREKGNKQK